MITLRPHQTKARKAVLKLLQQYHVAYLVGEVRTGKTLTALFAAYDFCRWLIPEPPEILIITTKNAIPSIQGDINNGGFEECATVINYESLHKYEGTPVVIIIDEAHRLGTFPKPNKAVKHLREHFRDTPTILMSGTPSPESFSQLFHQFHATGLGPWGLFPKFYTWAHHYVNVKQNFIGGGQQVNDYSEAKPEVVEEFNQYTVTMSQKDAGFDGEVKDIIHTLPMPPRVRELLNELGQHQIHVNPYYTLEADTAAKLSSYYHQICSGTVIGLDTAKIEVCNELQRSIQISTYKADYIQETFSTYKIAIFYVFKEEGEMLRQTFTRNTDDAYQFNNLKDYVYIKQIKSGREGVDLHTADAIIYFNIPDSALSYMQGRARSQSQKGGNKECHFIFSEGGIEQNIYNIITQDKKKYTTQHFKTYVREFKASENNQVLRGKRMDGLKVKGVVGGRVAGLASATFRSLHIRGGEATKQGANKNTAKKN